MGWSLYAFHSIMQIYLSSNPWHCDIRLSWIYRGRSPESLSYLFDNGYIHLLGSDTETCTSPSSLKGVLLSDLGEFDIDCQRRKCWNLNTLLCRELVCITVKWTWYNGRDKFFHITSGRINTWKGVNQLKELFFLNLIIFFKYIFEIDKSYVFHD